MCVFCRMRLQEGFHFASSNSGIVNLVLETDMKVLVSDTLLIDTKQATENFRGNEFLLVFYVMKLRACEIKVRCIKADV